MLLCHLLIPNNRLLLALRLILLIGLFLTGQCTYAKQPPSSDSAIAAVWPIIEAQLDENEPDTALFFVKLLVRAKCGDSYACLKSSYEALMFKLEKRFDLLASIYVGEELIRLAKRNGDKASEAKISHHLARYYDAIGNAPLRTESLQRALRIFQELGDWHNYFISRTGELIWSYADDYATCYLMLEMLLEQAQQLEGHKSIPTIITRLAHTAMGLECYEEATYYIGLLEEIPVSPPYEREEYGILVNYHHFSGLIAFYEGNYQEAKREFEQTRYWCEQEPSRWVEVAVMNEQAELDLILGNQALAKARLDTAEIKAKALQANDLIAAVYYTQAVIAEQLGEYEEALENTRSYHHYQTLHTEKKAGFDVRNYYLLREKERLAAEKSRQELELELRNTQLRSTALFFGVVLLFLVGLIVAVIKLRKREEVLAEQNLLIQEQAERLKSLDLAKSRFFANVSHELRTPLTLMLGPVRTLLNEKDKTPKQEGMLRMILKSGQQLGQLVSEILDLGKLEMDKMNLEEKSTRVAHFFEMGVAQFESLAERKQIRLRTYIAPAHDVVLKLDTKRVQRILNNLLSNAFKFTPEGGQVEVRVALESQVLHLFVRDTGLGIHPDDVPHLFERYFQTFQEQKPAEGGTGIGLALCYEYARLMGGNIEVESKQGEGTTFHVYFPVKAGNPAELRELGRPEVHRDLLVQEKWAEASVPPISADEKQIHILVVEDHPSLQEYLMLLLAPHYAVYTVDHGKAALDYLQAGNPCDLVLTDLMMPIMDGYMLLQELRNTPQFSHLPVMMLTARADTRDRIKALRIGVDDYLLKPFEEDELLARLENLITNRIKRNELAAVANEGGQVKVAEQQEGGLFTEEDQDWLKAFEAHLLQHISDPHYNVPTMTETFAMSESTLRRNLKRMTGLTPSRYLQEVRLSHARYLLENSDVVSIQRLAQDVGYKDAKTFSRSFKRRFGRQPSTYLE